MTPDTVVDSADLLIELIVNQYSYQLVLWNVSIKFYFHNY